LLRRRRRNSASDGDNASEIAAGSGTYVESPFAEANCTNAERSATELMPWLKLAASAAKSDPLALPS
jgi:hypothetical protein